MPVGTLVGILGSTPRYERGGSGASVPIKETIKKPQNEDLLPYLDGAKLGWAVGAADGTAVGDAVVGAADGTAVGEAVVGAADGNFVGEAVGVLWRVWHRAIESEKERCRH